MSAKIYSSVTKDDLKVSYTYKIIVNEALPNGIHICDNLENILTLLRGYASFEGVEQINVKMHNTDIKKDGLAVGSFWDVANTPGDYSLQISVNVKGMPPVDVRLIVAKAEAKAKAKAKAKSYSYRITIPRALPEYGEHTCSNLYEVLEQLHGYIDFKEVEEIFVTRNDGLPLKSFWDTDETPGDYTMKVKVTQPDGTYITVGLAVSVD
jgi:hypothetical protein